MAVTRDITQAHIRPRVVMTRLLGMGVREDRALAMLMIACALFFVAQWPSMARQAHETGEELSKLIAYGFLGGIFMLPLICYGVAAVVHIIALALGGRGTWYHARLALFWSMLVTSPTALLWGLMQGLNDNTAAADLIGYIGCAVFLWVFINSIIVAETS